MIDNNNLGPVNLRPGQGQGARLRAETVDLIRGLDAQSLNTVFNGKVENDSRQFKPQRDNLVNVLARGLGIDPDKLSDALDEAAEKAVEADDARTASAFLEGLSEELGIDRQTLQQQIGTPALSFLYAYEVGDEVGERQREEEDGGGFLGGLGKVLGAVGSTVAGIFGGPAAAAGVNALFNAFDDGIDGEDFLDAGLSLAGGFLGRDNEFASSILGGALNGLRNDQDGGFDGALLGAARGGLGFATENGAIDPLFGQAFNRGLTGVLNNQPFEDVARDIALDLGQGFARRGDFGEVLSPVVDRAFTGIRNEVPFGTIVRDTVADLGRNFLDTTRLDPVLEAGLGEALTGLRQGTPPIQIIGDAGQAAGQQLLENLNVDPVVNRSLGNIIDGLRGQQPVTQVLRGVVSDVGGELLNQPQIDPVLGQTLAAGTQALQQGVTDPERLGREVAAEFGSQLLANSPMDDLTRTVVEAGVNALRGQGDLEAASGEVVDALVNQVLNNASFNPPVDRQMLLARA